MPKFSCRDLKREVLNLLSKKDLPSVLEGIKDFPPKKTVNVLIGFLCHREDEIRWKASAAIGPVVAKIASEDLEAARIIIRRFMWMLNEESGGMAWGVPEAMAESLANHRKLAEEYTSILISYIWEEGNYLEYPPAHRGVIWGIGRLAQVFPDLLQRFKAPKYALHLSESSDSFVRAFWIWAYLQMKPLLEDLEKEVAIRLKNMPASDLKFLFYDGKNLRSTSYKELLEQALRQLS